MKFSRTLLFTRCLGAGGAERQIVLLAKDLHGRGIPVAVMVFYGNGIFRSELDEAGVPVIDLKKSGRYNIIGFALKIIRSVRDYKPSVIYSFMSANIIATILQPFLGGTKVVWGVRSSDMNLSHYDWLTRLFDRFSISLSRFADAIICNSESGRLHIENQGYRNPKMYVISNGIEAKKFTNSPNSRLTKRLEWNVPEGSLIMGNIARIDPMKDHANLLMAVKSVIEMIPGVHLVCIGSGSSSLLSQLEEITNTLNIKHAVHWLGHSENVAQDYSAIDLLIQSSSFGEGFPNVIGEAMACGLPVVATDVGDCRQIVGDCGWIVPPRNPQALATAIGQAIKALPQWSAERSRARIKDKYGVVAMVDQTLAVLNTVVNCDNCADQTGPKHR